MEYIGEPSPYQMDLVELSKKEPNLALLWDPGTGKTYAVIHALRWDYSKHYRLRKTLILSPIVTLWNWKNEFKKFSKVEDKVFVIDKKGAYRIKQLEDACAKESAIIVLNWEALRTKKIYDILYRWNPEIIVGDEVHVIKSYKSSTAKSAVILADLTRASGGRIFTMTGTAILNSIEDIYMQYRFLDGGQRFGSNFFSFRSVYMRNANEGWSGPNSFPNYIARPEMFDQLNSKIYSCATSVDKKQAMPYLPDLIEIKRTVELSAEQEKMYKEMKRDYITWVNDQTTVVAQLALTKLLRLQQIVCGHVNTDDNSYHIIKKNPRLEALRAEVKRLTPNHKVIIWHTFKADCEIIGKMLKEEKIAHVYINGSQDITAKQEAQDAFNTDDKVRVLVGNRRAGGIGINLVTADYSIIYSRNFSLGEEEQSKARNYRRGSERFEKIIRITLIAKDTIDEVLAEALESKSDIASKVLAQIKE